MMKLIVTTDVKSYLYLLTEKKKNIIQQIVEEPSFSLRFEIQTRLEDP